MSEKRQVRAVDQTAYPSPNMHVASLATDCHECEPVAPCVIKKGEERRKKREKFYIYSDVTHTHTTLSHTHNTTLLHTALAHTHTISSHTTLSHNLSSTMSFLFPAFHLRFGSLFGGYCKKLTCGVTWSFN